MSKGNWVCILLMLLPLPVWALKSDAGQPINIEADSADIDDNNKTRTFTGNVVVTQGSIRLSGNRLVVYQNATAKGGNRFHATGSPARFQQELESRPGEWVRGHAKRIEYDSDSEFLHLIGNAFITQEGDSARTDRITYDKVRNLVKGGAAAKGRERVRMVIQSNKDKP
jgi:lipopolysaccharide export system protein LptA